MLFGGVIALFFDAVMAAAVLTVNDRNDQATVTLSVDFLRPARGGKYIFDATVVKKGRNLVFVEGQLYSEGKLSARAKGMWIIK